MSLNDWILALHLLSAFLLMGALTIFSVAFVVIRGADTPGRVLALGPAVLVAQRAVLAGVAGTFVFGVWLAISNDGYALWDPWVILGLVGWAIATAIGSHSGGLLMPAFERAEELAADGKDGPDADLAAAVRLPRAHTLHWVMIAVTVLVLADMIWKPGA